MNPVEAQQAIVIGGSVAGLTTAEILSRYFERVTVIERDRYPETPDFRKGIPQNRQPHALLKRGLLGLEEVFPGFTKDWAEAGAIKMDFGHDIQWYAFGRWRPEYKPGLISYGSSRPLLETTIRRRVQTNPKVCFVEAGEVVDLVADQVGGPVTGVRLRLRDGKQAETTMQAALVIDASGRESHAQEWLQNLGYPCPERVMVNAHPGYSSRIYERPASFTGQAIYIQPNPPHQKRGAIVLPMEGNRLQVALIGMDKDYPPTDEVGFLDFLAGLPEKHIYDLVKASKPLTPISGYRRAENIWLRYDQLEKWPDNFVVLGDAVLAFNPVYGQGMTVAILSALKLGEALKAYRGKNPNLNGFSQAFQKELGKVQAFAWQLATGEDMRWSPDTEGCPKQPNLAEAFRLGFLKKVMIASTKDPVITEALYRVMNMVASPATFFRPDMMIRILRAS